MLNYFLLFSIFLYKPAQCQTVTSVFENCTLYHR